MLTEYFKFKTQTEEFINHTKVVMEELKGKRILVCGSHEGFIILNQQYAFTQKLSIIAFADFSKKIKKIKGLKTILPQNIAQNSFEYILITDEYTDSITNYLMNNIDERKLNIKALFYEKYRDAASNLNFLLKHKFTKTLPELEKKLKDKKVLFYGAGLFFKLINEYYDISKINAIGVVDKKLSKYGKQDNICGYKIFSPEQIESLRPDYVVVATRKLISVYEDLYFNYLHNTNIKIIPIVKRSFKSILIEG